MKSRKLHDGVDLRLIESTKFKTNTLTLYFHLPLSRETVTYAALLPAVLKRGSKKYPRFLDMTRHLTDLYSSSCSAGVRFKGDTEVLYFSMSYISDQYIAENLTQAVTDFLGELIFSPLLENGGFLPAYVDSEKNNLKNVIESLINDKKAYADAMCRDAMFGKEGYGLFEAGYVEDLDLITPQSLYAFYQKVLSQAKVDLFMTGTLTEENIETVCQGLLPLLPPREVSATDIQPALTQRKETQFVVEEIEAAQSKLSIGLCCGVPPTAKEYYALLLGSYIFGGSPVSKLFQNVREKLSLAYYAGCRTDRLKSVMTISSGIETKNYQAAYDEIMAQLQDMKTGTISEEELFAAKKYLTTVLSSMEDSPRAMEDYYLSQVLLHQKQSPRELLDEVQKVTVQEIQAVMKHLVPDTVYFLKGSIHSEKEACNHGNENL